MASSSSAMDNCDNYDVFLSFRGEDTRNKFTGHLYNGLQKAKIKVFIDNKIKRGEKITSALERKIEEAKISIIVFSKNYADSTFCLDELVQIMECEESKGQRVLPIFYEVEPSEATYEKAFDEHKANLGGEKTHREERIEEELKKVEKWKLALREAVDVAGWHIKKESIESDIIDEITDRVSKILMELNDSQSKGEKLMYKSMVGHTADAILKKIWECLMNDKILRVGIYGMGGVGKTTIATRVYDELRERAKFFTHVYWVSVSKNFSIGKLQNKIAKRIKLDLSEEDDNRMRAAKLRERLSCENFVLILDDVWEAFEIEDMGIPSLVGAQKLLLTSRSRQVCKGMKCQPIKVEPLSKDESLDLFMKEHGNEIQDSVASKGIVHSIVGECAGLPLAIVVMARRMREIEEISEWRNVLRKLKEPCKGENHEMEEQVFKPLKLSYDNLPDYQYQQCFLFCSLFPEDHLQMRDSLIEYLIGEGLVGELDSRQAELDLGNAIINGLINASLLEVTTDYFTVGVQCIKMHDMVRNMAEIVIRENLKVQEGLKLQHLSKETKRCFNLTSVLIMKYSMLESVVPNLAPNASKLTTLSFEELSYVRKLPSCFFANMQNLAVLDMSGMTKLVLLPDSISYLESLRVLLLRHCATLEYIPSLAELKNLRYLDCSLTRLKQIPKGMKGLINLKVLKISSVGSSDAFFPGAFFSRCLHIGWIFSRMHFLQVLSHLQILEIDDEVEAEALISLEKLKTLRIVFYNFESLNSYFKSGHWKRLEKYFIVYLLRKKKGMPAMWREKNEFKKVLFVEKLGDIGETDITLPNNIQFLKLGYWNGTMVDVKNNTFHNLRKLVILNCEDIQHVFTPAFVKGVLLNVEELNINWGSEVEEIISEEEELMGEINNYYDRAIHLPHLKHLQLRCFYNLRSIYKGKMVCPSLERIDIGHCGELERFPFCMKGRNLLNPIRLRIAVKPIHKWWDSLHWDDPHAKSFYQVEYHAKSFYQAEFHAISFYEDEDDDPTEEDDDPREEEDESVDLTLKP